MKKLILKLQITKYRKWFLFPPIILAIIGMCFIFIEVGSNQTFKIPNFLRMVFIINSVYIIFFVIPLILLSDHLNSEKNDEKIS